MTGLVASIVEAYGELRVNKGRIMLSLIGVAFSVFALTATLGAGGMLSSALEQSVETFSGRPTVLTVMQSEPPTGEITPEQRDEVVLREIDRLGIDQRTRYSPLSLRYQTGSGVRTAQVTAVDPAYADMFRLRPEQGRWLADSDARRLAPAVVVNAEMWELMGRPEVGRDTVTLYAIDEQTSGQALLVGVLPKDPANAGMGAMAYTPMASVQELPGVEDTDLSYGEYRVWVPPEEADAVTARLSSALRETDAGRFEAFNQGFSFEDSGFGTLRTAIIVIAVVILLLGALGLVNISLVTVRYRVREIGIRRSYGATGGRIFTGVMMESVVATVLSGAVGVAGAVALVRAPFTQNAFRDMGLVDLPPFPVSAVLIGLLAATAVGVLAGALPALIATRIKVIDAIRS
ncbi:ABC transporter permease [Brachybacterium phenoliresistens]|uniref:ABC transporter permease n=1 Tax=Brachybacterium phenoliresistens TaxID=396014 RepID=UPI0031E21F3C